MYVRWTIIPILLLTALTTSCASLRERLGGLISSDTDRLVASVSIVRDAWGVPHVYAQTEEAAAFGIAYAQAEDDFQRLEDVYLRALGRRANLLGEAALGPDLAHVAFDVSQLARDEYDREPREMRRFWDAYALGVNYYLEQHPDVEPRLLRWFEGWHLFAYPRSLLLDGITDGVRLGSADALPAAEANVHWQPSGEWTGEAGTRPPRHAVGWAVGPSRTSDGRSYVLLELEGDLAPTHQPYEAVVVTPGGRMAGAFLFGTPVALGGHDGRKAWTRAIASGDVLPGRAFRLAYVDSAGIPTYRFGGQVFGVENRRVDIAVNSTEGVQVHTFNFQRTELGPIVAQRADTTFAVAIAGFEEGGFLQQMYALAHAASYDEFITAAALPVAPIGAAFYADENGAMLRIAAAGWQSTPEPDASTPGDRAEAQPAGPRRPSLRASEPVLATGRDWLVGMDTETLASSAYEGALRAAHPIGFELPRAAAIESTLAARDSWTFDAWARFAFDRRFPWARSEIARLVDIWERLGAVQGQRAARVDAPIELLRLFDGVADTTSAAATLYAAYTGELAIAGSLPHDTAHLDVLERAAERLHGAYASLSVPLGQVFRLRAPASTDSAADSTFAVPASPPSAGIVNAMTAAPLGFGLGASVPNSAVDQGGEGRVHGRTWVMAVALGGKAEARSIVPYGQSGAGGALHARDQAALFVAGVLKTIAFGDSAGDRPTLRDQARR